MKKMIRRILAMIFTITTLVFSVVNNSFATSLYPGYNPYYPNYNPYYPVYPNYNPYYSNINPNGTYAYSKYGAFIIPYDSYYYMVGYDREGCTFSNGQVMQSRVPILSGNYPYPTQVANILIYSAYVSISRWCNDNILRKNNIENYYLNNAVIQSVTPTQVVLIVNCALQRQGVINGFEEFLLTINIQSDRYIWRKIGTNGHWLYGDGNIYEYDSATGNIIIIH